MTAPSAASSPAYSRKMPSPRYTELQAMYKKMHLEGDRAMGIAPQQMFPGQSLLAQAARIKALIDRAAAKTLLDYGCGKGLQYKQRPVDVPEAGVFPSIQEYWGVDNIALYDPCFVPHSFLPKGTFHGVICTDVLEHCPEDDIGWILREIFSYAEQFVFANIACFPAKKKLPNGENAHCTIKTAEWWRGHIDTLALEFPHLRYRVWIASQVEADGAARIAETCLENG